MPLLHSDLSGPSQVAQNDLWLYDRAQFPGGRLFPSGRLHSLPSYFRVNVTWTFTVPATPTTYTQDGGSIYSFVAGRPAFLLTPPPNQLFMFDNIQLQRDPIQKYVPDTIPPYWFRNTKPKAVYERAHFVSPFCGVARPKEHKPEDPLVHQNVRWYLVYSAGIADFDGVNFDDQAGYAPALDFSMQDGFDSFGSDSSGQEGGSITLGGWVLLLVRQEFKVSAGSIFLDPITGFYQITDPGGTLTVLYHLYGGWALTPPLSPFAPSPIFSPLVASSWTIFRNDLHWPPHTLTLTPFQP